MEIKHLENIETIQFLFLDTQNYPLCQIRVSGFAFELHKELRDTNPLYAEIITYPDKVFIKIGNRDKSGLIEINKPVDEIQGLKKLLSMGSAPFYIGVSVLVDGIYQSVMVEASELPKVSSYTHQEEQP